jgi:hypothetical protein
MLILIIFLFIIYLFLNNQKKENFNNELPNLSNKNLKESVSILNNYLTDNYEFENTITHFFEAINKFNYFTFNNSPNITIVIPLNKSITQYLTWIFSNINNYNNNAILLNNKFILGNIFNKMCIMDENLSNCGPFTKQQLINSSNGNLKNNDFIISDIYFKHGIIHIVDFILENSNDINLLKKKYFIDYNSEERQSHISSSSFS